MSDTLDLADLHEFVDAYFQVVIAEANEAGYSTEEILTALKLAVTRQWEAYEADPDPVEEPAASATQ